MVVMRMGGSSSALFPSCCNTEPLLSDTRGADVDSADRDVFTTEDTGIFV